MKQEKKLSEDLKFYGVYTITVVDQHGKIKSQKEVKNLVPTVFRASIMDNIFNASPSDGILATHIAVGSGTTAAANGDTTLETEVARVAVVSRSSSDNVGSCSAVFPAGTATGTHEEIGIFAEATSTPDDGILASRTLSTTVVGALDSLFIDWRLTCS